MNERRPGGVLRDLPLPGLFFTTAGIWILFQLIFRIGNLNPITVVTNVVGGLVFGAVMTGLVAVNRRRLGGRGQASAFTTALRTGTPPPDADTTRWRDELDRLDRTRNRRTLVSIGCSILPIGLGVLGLFDPEARLVAVLLLLLFLGLDTAVLLALPGQKRRTDRLRANLTPSETSPASP